MPFSNVQWTLSLPHTAKVAAHGGAVWCLTIEPRSDIAGYGWHVAHSNSRASRGGSASTVNFAKAQAEAAGAELEAAAAIIANSTGQASRGGSAVNFAKAQSEAAGVKLEAAAAIEHQNRRKSDTAQAELSAMFFA